MVRTLYTPDIDEHLRGYFLKAENYLHVFTWKLYLQVKHLNFVNIHTQAPSQMHSTIMEEALPGIHPSHSGTHTRERSGRTQRTQGSEYPSINQASFLGAWLSWLLSFLSAYYPTA